MQLRLLSLARHVRLALTISIVSGLVGGWLVIGQAYLVSSTISRVFLGHEALGQVSSLMGWLLLVIAGRGFLTWINELAANRIAQTVKTDLRSRLLRHILALGPAFSRGERTGELSATSVEGIEALDAYFGQYLPQLIVGVLVPLSILLAVLPLDLLSGAILLVTAPLIPFFMYMIGRDAQATARRQFGSLGRLSSYFLDSLQGLTTLKAFGQSKAQAQNIARVSDEFRRATLRVMQGSFLSAFALELLATISTAIIAVEVGLRLLYAHMQFSEALFLLILAPEFYLPLRMLGLRFHAGMAGTAAARRIFGILDTPQPGVERAREKLPTPFPEPERDHWTIELTGVSYTYPGDDKPALRDVTLCIEPGMHIALVGATGAGKSTLASLLLGFVLPSGGRLSIRSESGTEAGPADRGRLMGWVPQHPHLFHDTVAANIRVGRSSASIEDVRHAARLARLDDAIESLPHKYETVVAEAGSRLSRGEAQRLALARAFLRDAPILILDEPTSALDPENESLLEESTRRLMTGRTVITIAHRLNTVFQADRILVLRDGQVVEAGSHRQLMERGGEYARLVDAASKTWRTPTLTASPISSVTSHGAKSLTATPMPSPRAFDISRQDSSISGSHMSGPQAGTFRRLLGFLRGSWGWIGLSVLLGGLTVGSGVALMGTSAWLISAAALHPSIAALDLAIVGVRFFGIARAVFRYLERLVTHSVTLQLLRNLRVWSYQKLEPLAPARLMHYASGDLLARVVDDVNTLENFFVRILAPPLVAVLVTLGASAYLAGQQASLAIPLAGCSLLIGLVLPVLVQAASRPAAAELIRSRAALQAHLVDTVQGLADIVAFGLEGDRLEAIRTGGAAYGAAQTRLARVSGLHSGLTVSVTNLAMWSLLVLAIPLVASGRSSAVMLAPLALITLAAFEAVSTLPLAAQWWNAVRAAADRVFQLVDERPAVAERPLIRISPEDEFGGSSTAFPPAPSADLAVTDLTFTYPGQGTPALEHLTFQIARGSSLGVVGASGAGKSSLVNVLMRFWEYDSGEILLGGIPLRAYSADEARARISLVSQDAYFFDTSIYENLRMAGRGVSRQRVEQAARDARIHDFICGLPAGYDTLVGEHGLRLSAGERQRLAIARALIKDAPLLVLDEPTANLDAATERLILETLLQLVEGRTTLLITHRLFGLQNLPEILVLSRGTVAERGSHAQLLELGGLYRRQWDLQNRIRAAP